MIRKICNEMPTHVGEGVGRERERERENLYIKKLYWVVSNVPADFTPCYSKVDFYQQ